MSDVPQIFDRALLRRRMERALAEGAERFLLERVADDLDDRLATVSRRFAASLDLGTPGREAVQRVAARYGVAVPLVHDCAGLAPDRLADDLESPGLERGSADLVVSLMALQGINDLPGLLAQVWAALVPDGLFIAALAGGQTLTELRQSLLVAEEAVSGGAAPRIFPFADVRALGQLMQRAGFALPVVDSETITVRYADPLALMHDLRAMGATNVLSDRARRPLGRRVLLTAVDHYLDHFADADGRVRATFEIIWLSGWAPHPRQQQPLKPGSAKMRLADALAVKTYGPAGGEEEQR